MEHLNRVTGLPTAIQKSRSARDGIPVGRERSISGQPPPPRAGFPRRVFAMGFNAARAINCRDSRVVANSQTRRFAANGETHVSIIELRIDRVEGDRCTRASSLCRSSRARGVIIGNYERAFYAS